MKKFLQLFLFFFLVLISIIFYRTFFLTNPEGKFNNKEKKDEIILDNQNNIIKNLKYNVNFDNNTQYLIVAELSEITYEGQDEIVKMQSVIAKFIDEKKNPLIIISDHATYNGSTYNTKFFKNVIVEYMGNKTTSDNLDLNFEENIVTIHNNVIYEGLQGLIKADNVVINLITKESKIFMNNSKNKVEVLSK